MSVEMRSRAHGATRRSMRESWAMLDRGFLVGACATARVLMENQLRPQFPKDRRRTGGEMLDLLRRKGKLTPPLGKSAAHVMRKLSTATHGVTGDRAAVANLLGDVEIVVMRLRVELARKEAA